MNVHAVNHTTKWDAERYNLMTCHLNTGTVKGRKKHTLPILCLEVQRALTKSSHHLRGLQRNQCPQWE